ncbi:MAG: pilin [Patescibacteria group bacterium]
MKKYIIIFFALVLFSFYFVGTADAIVLPGCEDVDSNGCIDEIDCAYTQENANCSLCPVGNCGQLPVTSIDPSVVPNPYVDPDAEPTDESWTGIDLTIEDVFDIINNFACWLIRVITPIMIIFIVIAGLRFMHARGDPAAYAAAKKNFNHVILGLIVIMGVYVIIATVANFVGADFSFIPLVC